MFSLQRSDGGSTPIFHGMAPAKARGSNARWMSKHDICLPSYSVQPRVGQGGPNTKQQRRPHMGGVRAPTRTYERRKWRVSVKVTTSCGHIQKRATAAILRLSAPMAHRTLWRPVPTTPTSSKQAPLQNLAWFPHMMGQGACWNFRLRGLPKTHTRHACAHIQRATVPAPSPPATAAPRSEMTCTVAAIRVQSAMYQHPCCASQVHGPSLWPPTCLCRFCLAELPSNASCDPLLCALRTETDGGNRAFIAHGPGVAQQQLAPSPPTAEHWAGGWCSTVPSCCAAVGAQRLEPGCGFRGKGRPSPA